MLMGDLFEAFNSPPAGFLDGSVFKDVLYHGSNRKSVALDPGRGSEYGIYLSPSHRYARNYGQYLHKVFVNIKNPLYVDGKNEISPGDLTKSDIDKLKRQGYDGIAVRRSIDNPSSGLIEIVAFDTDQVHVVDVV
jgi:hypothetical protein